MLTVSTVNTFITVTCADENASRRRQVSCPPELSSTECCSVRSTPSSATPTLPIFSPKRLWSDECIFSDDWLPKESPCARADSPDAGLVRRVEAMEASPKSVWSPCSKSSRTSRRHYPKNSRPYGRQDSSNSFGLSPRHQCGFNKWSQNQEVPDEANRKLYVSEDPWSEIITMSPDGRKKRPTKMHMSTGPKYLCTFYVGIEDETSFTVAKRVIGPKGHKMKWIAEQAQAGAKIRLRGKGSMFKERDTGYESVEPLQINISVTTSEGYERTKLLVADLLNEIYIDYFNFCREHVSVNMWEDPRNLR